jgi:beta-xylosidase
LTHWPIVDAFFRDTSVCRVGDTYYLTGTTGNWGKEGVRIYKSSDLTRWEDLGLVWAPEKDATWQLKGRTREKFCMWAPEIHFLKGTFWIPYCSSYTDDSSNGTGLLKSTSGKVEGPYVDVSPGGRLTEGLDASLFEDDDGTVYFLHGGASIARMKDDMSGLAEQSRELQLEGGGTVGFEGIFLFKHDGRYYWSATGSSFPEHDYDCFVAMADKVEGPYRRRRLAISHGGHNMFFKDKQGAWWSTMFGGDNNSPIVHRPGLVRIEFAADGTVHPRQ